MNKNIKKIFPNSANIEVTDKDVNRPLPINNNKIDYTEYNKIWVRYIKSINNY